MQGGVVGQPSKLRTFIPDTATYPPGMTLPRRAWVRLNLLRTGVGRFRSCLYKWGMASSAACECSTEEQTVDHAVHTFTCFLRQVPIRCMQHVLVASKKRLVQGCENAVAHQRRATKDVECANVFFLGFIFHAHECAVYSKAYMRALLKIVARY